MEAENNFPSWSTMVLASPTENKPVDKILDNEMLVRLIKLKSEKDFYVLYDRYCNVLFGVLFKIVKRTDIAEDLLQEVFVKIWKYIDRYEPTKGTLFTWMLNIARNQAIDYLRSSGYRRQLQHVQIDLSTLDLQSIDGADLFASKATLEEMKTNTLQLEPKYAEVIDMLFFYGWTYEQTAQILNLPIGTVKTRARKAIGLLKLQYQP